MYENPGKQISLKTVSEMTAKYIAVKMSGNKIAPATSAADVIVGFVQRKGIADEALPVMIDGITMAEAAGIIAAGSPVCPTTGGKVTTAAGKFCGITLEAASADGVIIPVLITQGGFASMLKSIAVTTPATDLAYVNGQSFAPAGMVVTATFTDGTTDTTATIANANLAITPDPLATGNTAVTIAYTYNNVTKTTTQAITVTAE